MGRTAKLLILSLLASSCVDPALMGRPMQGAEETQLRKARMAFDVKEFGSFVGTTVLPRRTYYNMSFKLPAKTRVLLIETCHRSIEVKDPVSPYVFAYTPTYDIENVDSCPMAVSAMDDKGRATHAFMDFVNGDTGVADLTCDGTNHKGLIGASVCDVKHNKEQRIWFREKTKAKTAEGCNEAWSEDGGFQWRYVSTKGKTCAYLFQLSNGSFHRHISRGWVDAGFDL